MGLSYHYEFSAPENTPSIVLEQFLRKVEKKAVKLGFRPTMVLNVEFATDEQKRFARMVTSGYPVEDERLKGVELDDDTVWDFNAANGSCRLIPVRGVLLVLTNEQRMETVVGFLRYPKEIRDNKDRLIMPVPCSDQWYHRDFVDTPDPRYRQIVRMFAQSGYLKYEHDDYATPANELRLFPEA